MNNQKLSNLSPKVNQKTAKIAKNQNNIRKSDYNTEYHSNTSKYQRISELKEQILNWSVSELKEYISSQAGIEFKAKSNGICPHCGKKSFACYTDKAGSAKWSCFTCGNRGQNVFDFVRIYKGIQGFTEQIEYISGSDLAATNSNYDSKQRQAEKQAELARKQAFTAKQLKNADIIFKDQVGSSYDDLPAFAKKHFIKKRGFSLPTIQALLKSNQFGWANDLYHSVSFPKANGIIFKYINPFDQNQFAIQRIYLDEKIKLDTKKIFGSPSEKFFYANGFQSLESIAESNQKIIVYESPIKALAGLQADKQKEFIHIGAFNLSGMFKASEIFKKNKILYFTDNPNCLKPNKKTGFLENAVQKELARQPKSVLMPDFGQADDFEDTDDLTRTGQDQRLNDLQKTGLKNPYFKIQGFDIPSGFYLSDMAEISNVDPTKDHIILIAPTGSGKNHMIMNTITPKAIKAGLKVLLNEPTKPLADQLYSLYKDRYSIQLIKAGIKPNRKADIYISNDAASLKILKDFFKENSYLFIQDELHLFLKNYKISQYTEMYSEFAKKAASVICLTGTHEPLMKRLPELKEYDLLEFSKKSEPKPFLKILNTQEKTLNLSCLLEMQAHKEMRIKQKRNDMRLHSIYAENKDILYTLAKEIKSNPEYNQFFIPLVFESDTSGLNAEKDFDRFDQAFKNELLNIIKTEQFSSELLENKDKKDIVVLATSYLETGISIKNIKGGYLFNLNKAIKPSDLKQQVARLRSNTYDSVIIPKSGKWFSNLKPAWQTRFKGFNLRENYFADEVESATITQNYFDKLIEKNTECRSKEDKLLLALASPQSELFWHCNKNSLIYDKESKAYIKNPIGLISSSLDNLYQDVWANQKNLQNISKEFEVFGFNCVNPNDRKAVLNCILSASVKSISAIDQIYNTPFIEAQADHLKITDMSSYNDEKSAAFEKHRQETVKSYGIEKKQANALKYMEIIETCCINSKGDAVRNFLNKYSSYRFKSKFVDYNSIAKEKLIESLSDEYLKNVFKMFNKLPYELELSNKLEVSARLVLLKNNNSKALNTVYRDLYKQHMRNQPENFKSWLKIKKLFLGKTVILSNEYYKRIALAEKHFNQKYKNFLKTSGNKKITYKREFYEYLLKQNSDDQKLKNCSNKKFLAKLKNSNTFSGNIYIESLKMKGEKVIRDLPFFINEITGLQFQRDQKINKISSFLKSFFKCKKTTISGNFLGLGTVNALKIVGLNPLFFEGEKIELPNGKTLQLDPVNLFLPEKDMISYLKNEKENEKILKTSNKIIFDDADAMPKKDCGKIIFKNLNEKSFPVPAHGKIDKLIPAHGKFESVFAPIQRKKSNAKPCDNCKKCWYYSKMDNQCTRFLKFNENNICPFCEIEVNGELVSA